MSYTAKVLLDSIAPCGKRLTTVEVRFPRIILAEVNTHRLLSRNTASSRAIPTHKILQQVIDYPYTPIEFGQNRSGMQSSSQLTDEAADRALQTWLRARDAAVDLCKELNSIGLHKQWANRIIEPFQYVTAVWSATEWANFFHLRRSPEAQPEFKHVADMVFEVMAMSVPTPLEAGEWHLPLVYNEDRDLADNDLSVLKKISTARCARISYLTHDGRRDLQEDIRLYDRLRTSGHWSPFEHVAQALAEPQRVGNFIGWRQHRKEFSSEHVGGSLP